MNYLDDNLKLAINKLQFYIDKNSETILLIFDNPKEQMRYIKSLKTVVTNERGITMQDLYNPNTLVGLRYRAYYFMPNDLELE